MEFATPPTLTGNPGQPRDLQYSSRHTTPSWKCFSTERSAAVHFFAGGPFIRATNILLNFARSRSTCAWTSCTPVSGLGRRSPRQRIAVTRAMAKVDIHIERRSFGDNGQDRATNRRKLVPHVVRPWDAAIYRAAGLGDFAISSTIFWVNGTLIETSTVVTSMRGQWACSTMCTASGSNQKLNSCRGLARTQDHWSAD